MSEMLGQKTKEPINRPINKNEVIAFFDRCAENWDEELIRDDAVINRILDNAGIGEGMHVLDVACGTGVLFPDYLKRNVASVTGIDISPEMAKRAGENRNDSRIRVICGDVEMMEPDRTYDAIMVYNAFPHFPDPSRLIRFLAGLLNEGGRLSVAHGMSREEIDARHKGPAHDVSIRLMPAEELSGLFEPYFAVDVVVSDDCMYQVAGSKLGPCS